MRTSTAVLATAGLVGAGLVTLAPPALADERTCRGTLGKVVVDDLRVPSGALCVLRGTRVTGNIEVERGGQLDGRGIGVSGDVQGEGHRSVALAGSVVLGNIQVEKGGSALLTSNRVRGDVQSFTNRGAQRFTGNRVNGNLQCKENASRPTGGGNAVGGDKEGQCARL